MAWLTDKTNTALDSHRVMLRSQNAGNTLRPSMSPPARSFSTHMNQAPDDSTRTWQASSSFNIQYVALRVLWEEEEIWMGFKVLVAGCEVGGGGRNGGCSGQWRRRGVCPRRIKCVTWLGFVHQMMVDCKVYVP